MKYTIDKHDRYIVIEPLCDNLDAEKAVKLKGEFLLRNTVGQRNIILDLSNVRKIDESSIRLALLANRLCDSSGGLFILANLDSEVLDVLEMTHLQTRFIIVNSVKDAEDRVFAHELELDYRGEKEK
ncbi:MULTISPECIES: STAS domain-containing protein [Sphingobacterium]|jgi:anti-sigma B factor antagonist|uniref:STAS domain-containing protein n=1 Tax=Sphingobacterium TaxID=28453 RepID=UPI0004E5F2A8|nr:MULTISPECIES: STAS domain-containing protein [Sphingobacterium]CDT15964.1 putative anti-anti-sigma regulatory factor (Antagonist of anti-sigma factor) [Sphingobacterium sp. PM2-P1-29]SJN30056.1 Anti-sigma F factor antagonist (spoIIAA-2); Anti-sigma B factor antagonist RsbV [Sphingobacterium faecium PCAi_F2.5]HCU45807.1 anti-sigma factor antagonist [Sphingobacterium sp.]UPZ37125.1 STAS domain-containing protein [Sphingobacterium sp. PCS056]UXD68646.1 STAS domain-containing protein [Sphingoba